MTKKKKIKGIAKKKQHKKPLPPAGIKRFRVYFEKLSPIQFNLLAIVVIIIVGYLSYSNSLNGEMIFDDFNIIKLNNKIHDLDNFTNINKWMSPQGRPLAMLSYAFNYSIHENNVYGYHLFNLIIHLIYACFVFLLARLILSISIFDNNPQRKYTGLMAFFIALICVIHPIQTQAVSYIVQRMASMATMFYIMSLFFYGKGRLLYIKDGVNFRVLLLYLFALFSTMLGLLSKQIVITIPFALLLFELFFIRNKVGYICKKYLGISFSILFVFSLIIIFGGFLPKETETITRSEYLFTQFRVIIKYLQLLLFPINQALDYNFSISENLFNWKVIVSLFIILVIIIAAFLLYKKKHLVAFGIFWFFLTLSVESSIIPIKDVIFEHRLYLPMFGFSLILVSIIWDLFAVKRLYIVIVFFLVLNVIFAVLTYERNKAWQSRISLWSDNIEKEPLNPRAHHNLAFAYLDTGDFEKAEKEYEETIRIKPDYLEALFNLGNVRMGLGKLQDAISAFDQLIAVDSLYYKAYYGRGVAHGSIQEYEKALNDFDEAIRLNPEYAEAYNNRGTTYLRQNRYGKALDDFQKALEFNPNETAILKNIALIHFNNKNYKQAIDFYSRILTISPQSANIINDKGLAYHALKEYENAYADISQARQLGYKINPEIFEFLEIYMNDKSNTQSEK